MDVSEHGTEPLPAGLHPFAYQAARHWSRHCPAYYGQLERSGMLVDALVRAADSTVQEMEAVFGHLLESGMNAAQAQRVAWEEVRERYILLQSDPTDGSSDTETITSPFPKEE